MKKLLIIIALLPLFAQSQKVKYSVFLSPDFSFYSTNYREGNQTEIFPQNGLPALEYWGIGGGAGYSLEYYLPKTLATGISVEYLLNRAALYTPCYCISTGDRIVNIRNFISINSADIPVHFKLRTNKNENRFTYIQGAMGISWLFLAHRKVAVETNLDLVERKNPIREQIDNATFPLKNSNSNSFGTFFQFGIGQVFMIKTNSFFTEISYGKE